MVPQKRSFCAEYSRTAGEQLAGTVKPVDLWLLVEYRGRWGPDAISVFPATVQAGLRALKSKIPRMRLALIKQPGRQTGALRVFWAFSREHGSTLHSQEFSGYEELSFETEQLQAPVSEKIFAVCTHGAHDLCCAEYGNKIYSEIRSLTSGVWHISHLGGCRFAPNLICLPHGVIYGRVERADCAALVSNYQADLLLADKLRGRSCYSKPVQAAEQLLRSAHQLSRLDEVTLIAASETEPGLWSVVFSDSDGKRYGVSMKLESGLINSYKSCAATEPSPRERFRLVDLG
jgi:hypothetical protein